MTEPLVYIIILNWNGKELILDCLNSLKNLTYSNAGILVVDNGSKDGSVAVVKEAFPDVEILALPENLGFARGNNAGFEYVKNHTPEFVIFLNNDTLVDPGFVEPLIRPFLNDDSVGQTVPKIFYADKRELIWFAGSTIHLFWGFVKHHGIRKMDGPRFNQVKEIAYATGCCLCMKTEDFNRMNGFDESYPMYSEDADLSLRLKREGKKILFIPEAKIWHKVSASIGGSFSFNKWVKKTAAKIKLVRRNLPWYTHLIVVPMTLTTSVAELGLLVVRYFFQSRSKE